MALKQKMNICKNRMSEMPCELIFSLVARCKKICLMDTNTSINNFFWTIYFHRITDFSIQVETNFNFY